MTSSSPVSTTSGDKTAAGVVEHITVNWQGEFLAGGVSGIVQLLPSGEVIKSPWPGSREEACRQDLTTEAAIYERLGESARLVKFIKWDPVSCVLCLEHMPHGNLETYLTTHHLSISLSQRIHWIREAAEALQFLHAAGIMRCDIEPKKFLLDDNLSLRIIDFGGSSIDGSRATACPGT